MPSKARSLGKAVSSGNPLATGVINASDITGLNANALSDVDTVTQAPQNNQALVWSSGVSNWVPGTINSGVTSVNGSTGAITGLATVASPTFTGIPAAPTAALGTNTTQLATTAFVSAAVADLVASAPSTLNTLNELATALGNDANFSTTITTSLGNKLNTSGGTLTGALSITSSTASSSSTTGALIVTGGVGIGGALNAGAPSKITVSDTTAYATNVGYSPSDVLYLANTDQTTTGYVGIFLQHKSDQVALGRIALMGGFWTDPTEAALTFSLRGMSGAGVPVERMRITAGGLVLPGSDNAQDLGSFTYRWRNIYTADMHFSNEGSSNSVDGTWGSWTLQEGETNIYMLNNRTGKRYKIKLEEV